MFAKIFDDIHWSAEMDETWKPFKNILVTVTIDTFNGDLSF
jgi:hypothetical protein